MTVLRWVCVLLVVLTSGCARLPGAQSAPTTDPMERLVPTVSRVEPAPQPGRTLYQCDNGPSVAVQDEGDTVVVSGLPRGEERLGRDAGGVTPQQSVFSGPTLRVEFGLDADGRGMALQSLSPPELLHCRRG